MNWRPFSGSCTIFCSPTIAPCATLSVLSGETVSCTSMNSLLLPTSSCTLRRDICATCIRTLESRNCLNPTASTVSSYSPGSSTSNWYRPLMSVTCSRAAPVARFCSLTFDDTTEPPVASRTTPNSPAVSVCENKRPHRRGEARDSLNATRLKRESLIRMRRGSADLPKTLGAKSPRFRLPTTWYLALPGTGFMRVITHIASFFLLKSANDAVVILTPFRQALTLIVR